MAFGRRKRVQTIEGCRGAVCAQMTWCKRFIFFEKNFFEKSLSFCLCWFIFVFVDSYCFFMFYAVKSMENGRKWVLLLYYYILDEYI